MELKRNHAAFALLFVLALPSTAVHAAGFAIDYESARAIGMATAGSASAADASTIFYNPAGLGYLDRNEVLGGGQFLLLRNQFRNEGSTILGGALPTPGTSGPNAIPPSVLPWIYASYRLTPELTAGFALTAPWGLRTDWSPSFVGRYQNEVSSLAVVDFNPTLAYRPTKWLSIAAGPNVEYAKVRLTQALDFGSLCTAALGLQTCGAGFGLVPGRSDGQAENRGDSFGFGFTVGALAEPVPGTRVGITYRSQIDHHFSGADQRFVVYPAARAFLTAAGTPLALTGSGASTALPLPARLTFGVKQSLTDRVDVLLDATLTFWDVFKSLSITADNPVTGASVVTQQGYRNAWRWAVGVEYKPNLNQPWNLRAGVAYDRTPIPLNLVQAALPDRDRIYASIGASYQASPTWGADVAYSHLFAVGPVPISRTGPSGDTLKGRFTFSGDVFALQVKYRY